MNVFRLFLAADVFMMFAAMFAANRKIGIPLWKVLIFAVLLLPIGLAGTRLMFHIESGGWKGRSYFGAVFYVPVCMAILSPLFKLRVGDVLDLCAPAGCVVLGFMKIDCFIEGCCRGRFFSWGVDGRPFRFPSQLVEALSGFVLLFVILKIIYTGKDRGRVYAWYMFLYGISRFVLNWFRETIPVFHGLANGHIWSLVSILIGGGVIWFTGGFRRAPAKR